MGHQCAYGFSMARASIHLSGPNFTVAKTGAYSVRANWYLKWWANRSCSGGWCSSSYMYGATQVWLRMEVLDHTSRTSYSGLLYWNGSGTKGAGYSNLSMSSWVSLSLPSKVRLVAAHVYSFSLIVFGEAYSTFPPSNGYNSYSGIVDATLAVGGRGVDTRLTAVAIR